MATVDLADTLPNSSYRELLLLLLRRRKRFRVAGKSMLPLLQPGDEVLCDPRAYQNSLPKINDVVMAIHPEQRHLTIVKRITAIDSFSNYFLSGDNPNQSTDSRHWGTVEFSNIIGKVTSRFFC